MRIRPIGVLLILSFAASPAARPEEPPLPPGGFDDALKLWFPPDAPKEAYVRRDPAHPFAADVQKAFRSHPDLRRSVCERLASPEYRPDPGALEPSIAQLRTMEDMVCLSLAMNERMTNLEAKKNDSASDLLAGWFAEERAAAEKMSPADRRRAEYDLRNSAFLLPKGNERARAGVRMIALRPSDDMAIAFLLEHGSEARYGTPGPGDIESAAALPGEKPHFSISKRQVEQFVTDLYRSMIDGEGGAAGPFRSGWAGYLHLSGGDLGEARKLAAAFVTDPLDDNPGFETIFVAYLDRLRGDRKPLDALVGRCPFAAPDDVAASMSPNYCRTVSWSLAGRLIDARRRDASPAAAEIVREALSSEPANWTLRLASIRTLDLLDPRESAREYRALADLPATVVPEGVRLDAIAGVMTGFADQGDYRNALAVNQRWLDTSGYRPSPLPPDGWARLAASETVADSDAACPEALACMLNRRVSLATALGDMALARRTLEERLAHTLEEGFPEETRIRLLSFAQAQAARGRREDALRIVRYLWPQPKDPILAQLLKQERETLSPKGGPLVALTREDRPWDPERATKPER